jgi:DNA-binding NarL/FixJ family response regulator
MRRIVIVDDQASQREGRVRWLSHVPDVQVEGMTFERAAALGPGWADVQIAVLDGHDRRGPEHRAQAAAEAGIPALAPHDNFVGVRVATLIREHCTPGQTRIILISAYVRESELRSRRVAQAGVDYVFEHYEVDRDADSFVRAVLYPETCSAHREPPDWAAHGYTGTPDVAAAIAAMEASPAGSMLLADEPHKLNKNLEWALRTLRKTLHRLLRDQLTATDSGPRKPHAPRKSRLAAQLREALGKDLPVDPD